jgi:flagellar hook-basal body complex protein FliE
MTPIKPIDVGAIHGSELPGATRVKPADGGGFASTLADAISQARATETHAVDQSKRFADGDPSVGIHETMIAAEEANISLRYAVTLKNKVLEAYRELMSTQV